MSIVSIFTFKSYVLYSFTIPEATFMDLTTKRRTRNSDLPVLVFCVLSRRCCVDCLLGDFVFPMYKNLHVFLGPKVTKGSKPIKKIIVKRLGLGLGLGLGTGDGDGNWELGMGNGMGKWKWEMGNREYPQSQEMTV